MTTTLSAIDAGLQIATSIGSNIELNNTMNDFKKFHPKEHQIYIQNLRNGSLIRNIIEKCNIEQHQSYCDQIRDAYNDAVTAVAEFRFAHVEHIKTFILESVSKDVDPREITGTGGTPIIEYLCSSGIGTLDARIKPLSKNIASVSVPDLCLAFCYYKKEKKWPDNYCEEFPKMMQRMKID